MAEFRNMPTPQTERFRSERGGINEWPGGDSDLAARRHPAAYSSIC
jgi:hypothetical protein